MLRLDTASSEKQIDAFFTTDNGIKRNTFSSINEKENKTKFASKSSISNSKSDWSNDSPSKIDSNSNCNLSSNSSSIHISASKRIQYYLNISALKTLQASRICDTNRKSRISPLKTAKPSQQRRFQMYRSDGI